VHRAVLLLDYENYTIKLWHSHTRKSAQRGASGISAQEKSPFAPWISHHAHSACVRAIAMPFRTAKAADLDRDSGDRSASIFGM
jgi:hypothetical protein